MKISPYAKTVIASGRASFFKSEKPGRVVVMDDSGIFDMREQDIEEYGLMNGVKVRHQACGKTFDELIGSIKSGEASA